MSSKKKYKATFELANSSINNVFDIYKKYGDINKLEINGDDERGYSITVFMIRLKSSYLNNVFNSVNECVDSISMVFDCLPKEIDGVEIKVCFVGFPVYCMGNDWISTRRDL